jgi:hypothetical protein
MDVPRRVINETQHFPALLHRYLSTHRCKPDGERTSEHVCAVIGSTAGIEYELSMGKPLMGEHALNYLFYDHLIAKDQPVGDAFLPPRRYTRYKTHCGVRYSIVWRSVPSSRGISAPAARYDNNEAPTIYWLLTTMQTGYVWGVVVHNPS